jgi:hypothetical protein
MIRSKNPWLRWLAVWWVVVGAIGLLFVAGFSIAHFYYGMQLYDPKSGLAVSPFVTAWILGGMASGFALFAGIGAAILANRG